MAVIALALYVVSALLAALVERIATVSNVTLVTES